MTMTNLFLGIMLALAGVLLFSQHYYLRLYALKRELEELRAQLKDTELRLVHRMDSIEARLAERCNRIEDEQKRINTTLQTIARDIERDMARALARLDAK